MKRPAAMLALAFLTLSAPTRAQTAPITTATNASPRDIATWLNSGDPRLVSWGAYFAAAKAELDAIPQMQRLLAKTRAIPEPDPTLPVREAAKAYSDSLTAPDLGEALSLLDALIRLNVTVPASVLLNLPDKPYAIQKTILVQRLPAVEATPLLLHWYDLRNVKDREDREWNSAKSLARIAAMMLSESPPPGFVRSLLEEAAEQLTLEVVTKGSGSPGLYSGRPCGSFGDEEKLPKGWPPVFGYYADEYKSGPLLVQSGDDRVTYLKIPWYSGYGVCTEVYPLGPRQRHLLLARMLGLKDAEMAWPAAAYKPILWQSDQQFVHDSMEAVRSAEDAQQTTARGLEAAGLITHSEAAAIRPRLVIQVDDERGDRSSPLPILHFADSRTTLGKLLQ